MKRASLLDPTRSATSPKTLHIMVPTHKKPKATPDHTPWPAVQPPIKALTRQTKLRLFFIVSAVNFLLLVLPLHTFRRSQPLKTPPRNCENGTVFVYTLPSHYNLDLVDRSLYSDGGFGDPATASFLSSIPTDLAGSWYRTEQFALEVIFHNRMLRHPCRTGSPENASAFYVPFYPGLAVLGDLFRKNATHEELDRPCDGAMEWLGRQRHFDRFRGRDHFMVFGRITWDFRRGKESSWGASCIYHPTMENVTRLLIERHPWDEMDVGVPYPTGFHPAAQWEVARWQDFVRSKPRKALFSFAGGSRRAYKNDFRGVLFNHCKENRPVCISVDCSSGQCSNDSSATLATFLDSEFCLQPRGDSFTRKSVFDCLLAGAVPVFFWRRTAYLQYQWFLPSEPESYSVFIHRTGVINGSVSIREVLEGIEETQRRQMRDKVAEIIPRIVYERGNGFVDAVDVAVDEIIRRFKRLNL